MRVLVLGGGGFLGYHVVDAAQRQGHEVTVFTRGGSAPMDRVAVLTGDRTDDLDALRGHTWDAVVDTYTDDEPGATAIRRTAQLLSGAVGGYCYVSGMSVYAADGPPVPDERAAVRQAGRESDQDPLQARSLAKLAGEAAVTELFNGSVLIPRVGIMVGPRDPSQRFTWWPHRFLRALQGTADPVILGPGNPDRPVQYSDARDIADWMVTAVLRGLAGTFNAVGPLREDPLGQVLADCLAAARAACSTPAAEVRLQWQPDEDRLRAALTGVAEEARPLWYPEHQIPQQAIDSRAAAAAGLNFRSAADTAAQTLDWAQQHDPQPLRDFPEPHTD